MNFQLSYILEFKKKSIFNDHIACSDEWMEQDLIFLVITLLMAWGFLLFIRARNQAQGFAYVSHVFYR